MSEKKDGKDGRLMTREEFEASVKLSNTLGSAPKWLEGMKVRLTKPPDRISEADLAEPREVADHVASERAKREEEGERLQAVLDFIPSPSAEISWKDWWSEITNKCFAECVVRCLKKVATENPQILRARFSRWDHFRFVFFKQTPARITAVVLQQVMREVEEHGFSRLTCELKLAYFNEFKKCVEYAF